MAGFVQAPLTSLDVELEPIQLVAPDGTPTTETRYRRDLPPETLGWLYESMVVTRATRHGVRQPAAPGRARAVRVVPRSGGRADRRGGVPAQDRLAVPAVPRDRRVPGARHHARRRWARSGAAAGTAGSGSPRSAVAPIAIPIGTHGLHAVGAAMAAQRLGEDSVTVAFLGDGATSEGDAHEALNLAPVFKAPCVFFVQNNQWAISVPVSRQQAGPSIAHRAIGYGMPGIRVDGNDVLACYAVMAEAAARAREGGGPTLIEAVTYRLGPHTTSDDPTRYRSDEEVEQWRALDPIALPHLPDRHRGVDRAARGARRDAVGSGCAPNCATRSINTPDIDVGEVFDTVYADITPNWRASATSWWPNWRRRREMTQIIERPPMLRRRRPRSRRSSPRCRPPRIDDGAGDQPGAARRDGRRRPGAGLRRGRGHARRRVPGDRGTRRNLRRRTVFRHAAGGVGDHRHRGRDGDPRLRPGAGDPVRRVRRTRRSTRSSATWRSTGCAPAATSTCRSPSASRRSAESVRSNIIRSPPRPTGCTPPA